MEGNDTREANGATGHGGAMGDNGAMEAAFRLCLRHRYLVLVLVGILVVAGGLGLRALTIDAVPDLTPVQVQVLTRSPALGPVEMEQYVTFPVESAMTGLPGVEEIRSVSRYGLSAVTVTFQEGFDLYLARQLVGERLAQAADEIPAHLGRPAMAPMTTGLSEVFMFTVEGPGRSPLELRTLLDWEIAFRLRSVPGVVEVNSWGGLAKQYEVLVEPRRLQRYGLTLAGVFEALERNNASVGSGYIEHRGRQYVVRGEALATSLADLREITVATRGDGTPIRVADLAEVREGSMLRVGAATARGEGETVIGVVMMLAGENADRVVDAVKGRLQEIEGTLPAGVEIVPFYDRSVFVGRVLDTVRENLVEGGLLVVAVLLLLLGDVRAGLVVAAAIPLSMMGAFVAMVGLGISGNLMSLGAIDFGLIVDGPVVMVENISRRLRRREDGGTRLATDARAGAEARLATVASAAAEMARPVTFAVGIIILVYVPILSLGGVEGRMFRPMALTVILALACSLLLALVAMPVLSYLVLRDQREREPRVMRALRRAYEPALGACLGRPGTVVAVALVCFLASLLVFASLGSEFVPRLDEGDVLVQAFRLPGIALSGSVSTSLAIERTLAEFPEVETVVTRTGSPEIATDLMGIEISDVFVMLRPRDEWESGRSKADLIAAMDGVLEERVPGVVFSYTQPIEMRFNELIAGVRSDVAVKVFGDDLEELRRIGEEIEGVLRQVPGAAEVRAEQTAGLPVVRVTVDRKSLSRLGLDAGSVLDVVEATRAGRVVGTIFEGQRRFRLVVRLDGAALHDPEALGSLPLTAPGGLTLPLSRVARVEAVTGPAQISREDVRRRLVVESNVRGRDLAGFVSEARRAVAAGVDLAPGYYLEWGGEFEALEDARARLAVAVPLTLVAILFILYMAFGATRPALLVFANVPLAVTGGVVALAIRGLPFSVSAAVGFIALSGIAVLNGVVLVTTIERTRAAGTEVVQAARESAHARLRPIVMTALVASLGFVPMAVNTGLGAEVQRPLATVVIGGLVSSTLLTLLVLPALYAWLGGERRDAEDATQTADDEGGQAAKAG